MTPLHHRSASRPHAFTLVETLIALTILIVFAVSSTLTLNLFNARAAKNRNVEAARSLMENYVGLALTTTTALTPTTPDTDANGKTITINGTPVATCNAIGGTTIMQPVALIVGRDASAPPVVTGNLYWRVQNQGAAFGLNSPGDLVQVDFFLQYSYRGQTYLYNVTTFKANS